MMTKKRHKFLPISSVFVFAIFSLVFLFPISSFGIDLNLGASLGFGGAGIVTTAMVNGVATPVSRSEGPATVSLFLESPLNDFMSLGLLHARGVRLGPASSGAYYTGLIGRWYFRTPSFKLATREPRASSILVQQFSPFVGPTFGFADASVNREGDLVPVANGSGFAVGLNLGADYPLTRSLGLRVEVIYSFTLFSPASLSVFSAQVGFFCAPF